VLMPTGAKVWTYISSKEARRATDSHPNSTTTISMGRLLFAERFISELTI
jgi:hypothetical protein